MKKMWKRFLSAFLTAVLGLGCLTVSGLGATESGLLIGDANADQKIDAGDALAALQHSVELKLLSGEDFTRADVDGNDVVDAVDALTILQYSVELIDRFPVENSDPDPDPDPNPDPDPDPVPDPDPDPEPTPEPEPDFTFDPDPGPGIKPDLENMIRVTEAPYNAKGDGETNDRAAIQAAIDDAYAAGGGTVCLSGDKTFLTGNLILKSNIVLYFEDGAKLKQSGNPDDYVRPAGDSYEAHPPKYGHDSMDVMFGHTWYENYPLVYAGEGTENVVITGKGTIEMTRGASEDTTLHVCPIGLYRVSGFEISDITIQQYSTYAMMPYTCDHGLIKGVTIKEPIDGNTDGISLMNSQDIRITESNLYTGDDGIYIFASYNDPRGGTWWSSADPQPSQNIQVDNNHCELTEDIYKAFAMIIWGSGCPDQHLVEVSRVYVNDNYFQTMGIWNDNLFDEVVEPSPVKDIWFRNNEIGSIQSNFYETPLSSVHGYDSMASMHNGDFEYTGEAYWVSRPNNNAESAGAKNDSVGQDGEWYGYIDHLEEGDASLYQGIKLYDSQTYQFTAKVQSSGAACRMFVRDLNTQELIASKEFSNTEWAQVSWSFEVPETGNYQVGIERGEAVDGWARIDSVSVGSDDIYNQSIFTSQQPDTLDKGHAELGTRFSAKVSGAITKVRIYTGGQESGLRTVRLWDYAAGELVAGPFEWNVAAGLESWQYFTLPEPVAIQGNKEYVIAVSGDANAQCAMGEGQLAQPVKNGDLVTFADSGVYTDTSGAMPNQTTSTNFFRDIVFESNAQTIMTTQVPTDFDHHTGRYELGTRFSAKVDGVITKVRIYTCEEEGGLHSVSLWDCETQTLIDGPWDWEVDSGWRGWQEYELPHPIAIEANQDYIISVSNSEDTYYPRGLGADNSFNEPICNGDLITYQASGLYSVTLGAMPNAFHPAYINYFRDVVFVPDEPSNP